VSSAGVQALCGEGLRERPAFPIRKCVDPTSNLGLGCKPLGEKPYAPSDLKKDVGARLVVESECQSAQLSKTAHRRTTTASSTVCVPSASVSSWTLRDALLAALGYDVGGAEVAAAAPPTARSRRPRSR
jgi:hypothetical protein